MLDSYEWQHEHRLGRLDRRIRTKEGHPRRISLLSARVECKSIVQVTCALNFHGAASRIFF